MTGQNSVDFKNLFAVFLAFLVITGFQLKRKHPLLNKKVPIFTANTIENRPIDSSTFKGKVTLLCFLEIGCLPSLKEMGVLNKIKMAYSNADFQVIAIFPSTRKQLNEFTSDDTNFYSKIRFRHLNEPLNYTLIAECENENPRRLTNHTGYECSTISRKFKVDGYPETFIADRTGIIRKVFTGFAIEEKYISGMENDFREVIDHLIK